MHWGAVTKSKPHQSNPTPQNAPDKAIQNVWYTIVPRSLKPRGSRFSRLALSLKTATSQMHLYQETERFSVSPAGPPIDRTRHYYCCAVPLLPPPGANANPRVSFKSRDMYRCYTSSSSFGTPGVASDTLQCAVSLVRLRCAVTGRCWLETQQR